MRIDNNDALLELDNALPSLTSAGGRVEIASNDAMTRMDKAFPLLTSASDLKITYNAKLASVVTAFVKVTSLTRTTSNGFNGPMHSLSINSNAELVDVPGFEQEVQFAGNQLYMSYNAKLVSLTGLHQLKFTHPDGARLHMFSNPLLSREVVCEFWDAAKARGNPPQKDSLCGTGETPLWGAGASGGCGGGNAGTSANC
jgi:hypothetical protein